jgi:hypothetical protein
MTKETLRKTIRGLRSKLIEDLSDAAKSEYRLDLAVGKAKLPEGRRRRRERLEAWLDEQVRAEGKTKVKASDLRQRHFDQAAKEAAHTLINRLVFLRILEHHGVIDPAVVSGGWGSPAYEHEFIHYAGPLAEDDTRGYQALLDVIFAELAIELPGLFGPVGLTQLFPVPASTLREVVEAINDPALEEAWGDDTTLGWVYQYWNDPERESLDAKIAGGGKIEPHEIASKTQMFTERYMVEWLLQNSLGLTWLCICRKSGWTAEADAVLPALDERRAAWRKKREAGEVALDALMPVDEGLENAWKYFVPQPIPQDAVDKAPSSIREVKLLDPACGSGHFLVIAFDLLARMYEEEARHRGETWTRAEIARGILQDNLHGIDIDGRAVQIAAAGLWLKAKLYARDATLGRMNLVAPSFRLGSLPKEDPALVGLVGGMDALGVPSSVTYKLVESLSGVDYLGSLLRVDQAINDLLDDVEREDGPLFVHATRKQRAALEERLAEFLDAHAAEADLGLRLGGEQLAAGLRFVRLVKEGTYDVVVGNPPYQGLSKTSQFEYVTKNYPRGKADLYAAFLERGLELCRPGGMSALLTMRGWMFLGQFKELREYILAQFDLRGIGDFDRGAFDEVPNEVLAVAAPLIRRTLHGGERSIAVQPTPFDEVNYDRQRTNRKRAAVLAQVGRHEFDPKGFEVIEGEPIVYWWSKEFLDRYAAAPKIGRLAAVRQGMATTNNARFVRMPWEVCPGSAWLSPYLRNEAPQNESTGWVPYIKGASGLAWVEAANDMLLWLANGLEVKVCNEHGYGSFSRNIKNERYYFTCGVAFSMIGSSCRARVHRFRSVIGHMGSSAFPGPAFSQAALVSLINSSLAGQIVTSLNPGVHFEVGDICRLPVFPVANAEQIFATIEQAFTEHESHREPSVEFKKPGPSPWRYAQDWAQRAVDRPEGAPLPPYEPEYDPPDPEAEHSFAVGIALGRFGANGEGILGPETTTTPSASPSCLRGSVVNSGILFVSPSDPSELRDWLRKDFFPYHKALYENRPIYFPLSSEKRSFVAWVSIHRWADDTLQVLLADHLHPALREIDGEIDDLNRSRASSDKKTAAAAEKRYTTVKKLRDELAAFVDAVTECAERGAPPTDPGCPPREVDATFHMDLDDGVMINSAALWPLLEPQWKDPKKWWKQLCEAKGKKDYDWSHLAHRYFPTRVDAKCRQDPSLGVAHGCFWRYHPAKAYAWELRLKDEIRPDFTIDEADSDECRARFLAEHADEAQAIWEKEMVRRERKKAKQGEEDAPADGEVGEESETEGEDE